MTFLFISSVFIFFHNLIALSTTSFSSLFVGNTVLTRSGSLLITILTFLVYSYIPSNGPLTADRAFAALAVINILGRYDFSIFFSIFFIDFFEQFFILVIGIFFDFLFVIIHLNKISYHYFYDVILNFFLHFLKHFF